jgi:hypothetical protein
MRHILGFLNQSEWISTLNIGNIMQIAPITRDDFIINRRNEQELTRDAFLEIVSLNLNNDPPFIDKLPYSFIFLYIN